MFHKASPVEESDMQEENIISMLVITQLIIVVICDIT
jgi:hypothetical protein